MIGALTLTPAKQIASEYEPCLTPMPAFDLLPLKSEPPGPSYCVRLHCDFGYRVYMIFIYRAQLKC
jgi:hypothetical protein